MKKHQLTEPNPSLEGKVHICSGNNHLLKNSPLWLLRNFCLFVVLCAKDWTQNLTHANKQEFYQEKLNPWPVLWFIFLTSIVKDMALSENILNSEQLKCVFG